MEAKVGNFDGGIRNLAAVVSTAANGTGAAIFGIEQQAKVAPLPPPRMMTAAAPTKGGARGRPPLPTRQRVSRSNGLIPISPDSSSIAPSGSPKCAVGVTAGSINISTRHNAVVC
jgi:hypothetical protein